jgi:hypothetical protein
MQPELGFEISSPNVDMRWFAAFVRIKERAIRSPTQNRRHLALVACLFSAAPTRVSDGLRFLDEFGRSRDLAMAGNSTKGIARVRRHTPLVDGRIEPTPSAVAQRAKVEGVIHHSLAMKMAGYADRAALRGRSAQPALRSCVAACASVIRCLRLRQSNATGKSPKTCPALCQKIFRFRRWANQWFLSARLTRQEGRLAIVTKRAVGCGGRESCD